jgi:hypothetical protein
MFCRHAPSILAVTLASLLATSFARADSTPVEMKVAETRESGSVGSATPSAIVAAKETQGTLTRACVRFDQIDNSHSPVELYASVTDCAQNKRDADAVSLFVLAGMDSSFDSLRVTDKTAGQARQILIMGLFEGMPADVHVHFEAAIKALMDQPPRKAALCEQVKKIGPPQYFPAYMVNHGMGSVMGAISNKPPPPPLEPNFDASATWANLLTNYLECSSAASSVTAKHTNRTEVAHKVATLDDPGALFVTFSADSAKVVTAGIEDTLRAWTWQHGDPTNHSLTMPASIGLSRANIAIAFSRDGRYIAATHASDIPDKTKPISQSNSSCRTIQIWDAKTERPLIDLDDLPAWCNAGGVAFSNNGALLFVIEGGLELCPGKTDHVVVFSTADWKRLWNICVEGSEPGQFAVSPDDKLIAIGGYHQVKVDQSARPNAPEFESHEVVAIVSIQSHRLVRVIDGALPDQFDIKALAWSPDGKRLAVGGGNRRGDSRTDALKIYDANSGALVLAENSEYSDVDGIAYTSDGKYFIEGVVNKEVRIWDGSHEHLLQSFTTGWGSPFENILTALAVSPDNRYLAVTKSMETTLYRLK